MAEMKTAAVVMDKYKRKRFAKNLTDAGFTYVQTKGSLKGTITFIVKYNEEDTEALKGVIQTANNQSRKDR